MNCLYRYGDLPNMVTHGPIEEDPDTSVELYITPVFLELAEYINVFKRGSFIGQLKTGACSVYIIRETELP